MPRIKYRPVKCYGHHPHAVVEICRDDSSVSCNHYYLCRIDGGSAIRVTSFEDLIDRIYKSCECGFDFTNVWLVEEKRFPITVTID